MGKFTRLGRTLLAAAVAWSVGLSGCSKKLAPTPVSEAPDTFTDERDGQKYRTVVIGKKRWMAQNLNYKPQSGNFWCYYNYAPYCDKYGKLYDWHTARTICPAGYHLPTRKDWDMLAEAVGGVKTYYSKDDSHNWMEAGKTLKSTSGWNKNGNGSDDFGFSALPGGDYDSHSFNLVGDYGSWWTATVYADRDAYGRYTDAYGRNVDYNRDSMYEHINHMGNGYSVRCVANAK